MAAKTKSQPKEHQNSYHGILERFNKLASSYAGTLPMSDIYSAFSAAGLAMANQMQIQNQRVKAISSLPVDYTKEDIGCFLRNPYNSELPLRQTAQILRYTAYPFFKITKTYQDIPTYRHYAKPLYVTADDVQNKAFRREAILLDKFNKTLCPEAIAHKITGQAVTQGKVFYTIRYRIDKIHNSVEYAFMQQLPEDYCHIIGYNNVSGYTVSFDMMYFLQPGTDWKQFGDLFEPYVEDFNRLFVKPQNHERFVYASRPTVPCKNQTLTLYSENFNPEGVGNPRLFEQNGRWMYYVSLPIDKVWTFEIDDTNPTVVSPLSGLMLTYSQQSDYEAAQLSLLLNPLVKIFTGEIPYFKNDNTVKEDDYRLSLGGKALFESFFNAMTANTGGTALYLAPVENIRSHDYPESANANEISSSFNRYGIEKAGLSAILPAASDPKAGAADLSSKLEGRYSTATIYPAFCRMMNHVYRSLHLHYDWSFEMFGTIYTESSLRSDAQKAIANGDTSAHFILGALDGQSWVDKIAMATTINESGMLDLLIPPITSYTMKQDSNGGLPTQAGRPSKTIEEIGRGEASEETEKTIDTSGKSG